MSKTVHIARASICALFAFSMGGVACTGSTSGGGGGDDPDAMTPVVTADCDSLSGTPTVTIGAGISTTGFVAADDGDDMFGQVGPQGLFMVTPSICVDNMWPGQAGRAGNNPNDPEVVYQTFLVSDNSEIGGSATERLGLTPKTGCDELLATFVPFFDNIESTVYMNEEVKLRVTVKDACGQTTTDELTIIVTQT